MGSGELISAPSERDRNASRPLPEGKARKFASRASSAFEDTLILKSNVVLDMGEASREQGFRLFGGR